jgi:hypothetical protein
MNRSHIMRDIEQHEEQWRQLSSSTVICAHACMTKPADNTAGVVTAR